MIGFVSSFGLTYLAAALLVGGAGHLVGFAGFRDVVRAHGIVPSRLSAPAAVGVTGFELLAGAAALVLVAGHDDDVAPAVVLCAATAIAGLGFVLYVRRLLRMSAVAGCGCSPLAGPTTPASLLGGTALLLVSGVTLAAAADGAAGEVDGLVGALPHLWGVTLSVVVMLVPASMPAPAALDGTS